MKKVYLLLGQCLVVCGAAFYYLYATVTQGFHLDKSDIPLLDENTLYFSSRYFVQTILKPATNERVFDWTNSEEVQLRGTNNLTTTESQTILLWSATLIGNRFMRVGDIIRIQIRRQDVDDLNHGGDDDVRIWMEDETNGNRAAGHVIDLHNGYYIGVLKALWVGRLVIKVSVNWSKQARAVFDTYLKTHSSFQNISIRFMDSFQGVAEDTLCFASLTEPHNNDTCDLSELNDGFPWYCLKPKKPTLNCSMANLIVTRFKEIPYNTKERQIIERSYPQHILQDIIRVTVEEAVPVSPRRSCASRQASQSWTEQPPTGHLSKTTSGEVAWVPVSCFYSVKCDPRQYARCLRDRTVWFFGDSTTRQWFSQMKTFLNMTLVTRRWSHRSWHEPSLAVNKDLNISIFWAPHELPFYPGNIWLGVRHIHSVQYYTKHILIDAKDVIVFHEHAHFMFLGPEVYRKHIRLNVKAIQNLLKRNPNVKVFFKSPVAFIEDDLWKGFGDYHTEEFIEILKEEFEGLKNSVTLLDFWDFTVAIQNKKLHPETSFIPVMLHHFMGTFCSE